MQPINPPKEANQLLDRELAAGSYLGDAVDLPAMLEKMALVNASDLHLVLQTSESVPITVRTPESIDVWSRWEADDRVLIAVWVSSVR